MRSRLSELDANPDPLTFDLEKTVVIVVDMQNDFGSRGGMFDRAGIDISGIQKAVGPTAKVLAAARKAHIKIIYLKMGYKPDLSDLGAPDSVNRVRHLRLRVGEKVTAPNGEESRILVRDTGMLYATDCPPNRFAVHCRRCHDRLPKADCSRSIGLPWHVHVEVGRETHANRRHSLRRSRGTSGG